MHLHTNDFQIVKLNGKPRHANGMLDNANLPRNGSLTIRFRPRTYTGLAVFHCHILFHEDSGMMATIRYVKGGRSVRVLPAGTASVHDQVASAAEAFTPGALETPAPGGGLPDHNTHGGGHPAALAPAPRRDDGPLDAQLRNYLWLCRLAAAQR